MWTVEQRQAHGRAGLRYPSDLTDAEWALVEPFIPPAKRGGRRRRVDVREQAGREAGPTVAIIDSQSVKSAGKGARASIRRATMQARRPRATSAASSSARSVCC